MEILQEILLRRASGDAWPGFAREDPHFHVKSRNGVMKITQNKETSLAVWRTWQRVTQHMSQISKRKDENL